MLVAFCQISGLFRLDFHGFSQLVNKHKCIKMNEDKIYKAQGTSYVQSKMNEDKIYRAQGTFSDYMCSPSFSPNFGIFQNCLTNIVLKANYISSSRKPKNSSSPINSILIDSFY